MMWTRIYLVLLLIRLYFALSPSYIHPDENFQGPEVIAGSVFSFSNHLTWEFTSSQPVRSLFTLWPVYGIPMIILRWMWAETGKGEVTPQVTYYVLRTMMFVLSFVLEDWAIHELVQSPRQRRIAVILVASSYVTWTYQTHTFSNSVETLLVLWSLVLIQRILENKQHSSLFASALLGILLVFGIFNRITFPAFLLIPGFYLIPHFIRNPLSLLALLLALLPTTLLAILTDTSFYLSSTQPSTLSHILHSPTLTPLNSLLYNLSPSNLALHGTHPHYQHLLINLPLLLFPALPLLISHPIPSLRLSSALTGTALLSLFAHQEPRFLLPAIPLLLSSIRLPASKPHTNIFLAAWLLFNALLGILMGIYHQGGVIPMQIWLGQQPFQEWHAPVREVLWWKTYSPPVWLLDGNAGGEAGLETVDLMGRPIEELMEVVEEKFGGCDVKDGRGHEKEIIVVAPRSRVDLDRYTQGEVPGWVWRELRTEKRHLNLDDLDWGGEGVVGTLRRVVGRRGLVAWLVSKRCDD